MVCSDTFLGCVGSALIIFIGKKHHRPLRAEVFAYEECSLVWWLLLSVILFSFQLLDLLLLSFVCFFFFKGAQLCNTTQLNHLFYSGVTTRCKTCKVLWSLIVVSDMENKVSVGIWNKTLKNKELLYVLYVPLSSWCANLTGLVRKFSVLLVLSPSPLDLTLK